KKPIERLSGDQNGYNAPSVPASGCAVTEFNGRSHNRGKPFSAATNTIQFPSGDKATDIASKFAGVTIPSRISAAVFKHADRRAAITPKAAAIAIRITTTEIHKTRSRELRVTGGATLSAFGAYRSDAIVSSSMRRSATACHRRFGFLFRHRRRISWTLGFS